MTIEDWANLFSDNGPDWKEQYRVLEHEIRLFLADLPERAGIPTADMCDRLFAGMEKGQLYYKLVNKVCKLAKHATGIAHPVKEIAKAGRNKDREVTRWWWYHLPYEAPKPTVYAIPPSQMTTADVAHGLAGTYSPRAEQGTFGPAGQGRVINPMMELRERVERLEERVAELNKYLPL